MLRRPTCTIAIVIAFAGCTCRSKERFAGRIDGPIAAAVVPKHDAILPSATWAKEDPTHASAGPRQWETSTERCDLVVTKPKSLVLDIGTDCFDGPYTLASDAEGKRLAFRSSKPGAPYSILYFGDSGRSFGPIALEGNNPLAWEEVPTLDAVLVRVYRARESPLVIEEVRAKRGDVGLTDFLLETAGAGRFTFDTIDSPCSQERRAWFEAATSLSPAQKTRLADALAKTLRATQPEPLALVRATLFVDLDRDDLRDDVDRIAERGVKETNVVLPEAFGLALLAVAKRSPGRAAYLGCDRATRNSGWQSLSMLHVDTRAAFAAIGAAGYSCPAMTNAIERDQQAYCKYLDPPSDAAVSAAKAFIGESAEKRRRIVCEKLDAEKPFLTSAIAASKEASAMEPFRTVARRSYALRMPSSPKCSDLEVSRAGTPCAIDSTTSFVSALSCDPAEKEVTLKEATARIDDNAHALVIVRSAL